MKNRYFLNVVIFVSLVLTGCNAVKQENAVSTLTPDALCDQVKDLINQHQNGFSQLKGKLRVSKRMDVWDAKYHLVGNNCQIWRWADGQQTYMCSLTVPDEEIAIEQHANAVNFSKQCLGKPWATETIERNQGRAFRTIFSTKGQTTVASIHRIKTQGLFKSEWTVYYFIGDRDRSL